ncbi:MAG: peptidoglycan-binding domain-containing protein [Alphaproteobacteria bacterium]
MAVAHLTDRLKGGGAFVTPWPRDAQFPNRQQRIDIQTMLARLGYYGGVVDGNIGPVTQAAYARFQASAGLVADGFVTRDAHRLLAGAVQ